jgi:Fe-S-cluster containining protein
VAEAQRLAAALEVDWDKFIAGYTDRRWPGTESYLLRQNDGHCLFLQTGKDRRIGLCRIHQFRPADCRNWVPSLSKRECLKGLKDRWGIKVNDTWCLEGPPAKLKEFEHHLAVIMGVEEDS